MCVGVHVSTRVYVHTQVCAVVAHVPACGYMGISQLCLQYGVFSYTCLAFFAAELGGSGLGGGWAVGEGLFMPVVHPGYTFLWLCL